MSRPLISTLRLAAAASAGRRWALRTQPSPRARGGRWQRSAGEHQGVLRGCVPEVLALKSRLNVLYVQGVELFSYTEAFFKPAFRLSLAQHVHQFDAS